MIELRDISFSVRRPRPILDRVSLNAERGELVAVVGPNGAGKSTLLKIAAGWLVPSSGRAAIDGRDLTAYAPVELAKKRAVLSQHAELSSDFRVEEVVMIGRYPYFNAHPHANDFAVVASALERVGIAHLAARRMRTLSGGESQRVHLARVLAQVSTNESEGKLLLLDEPVSSLDARFQHVVLQTARRQCDAGDCVVVVLHDLNLAAHYADRVVLLRDGRKVADAEPATALRVDILSDVYGIPFERIERGDGFILVHTHAPEFEIRRVADAG
jgi:iron complex transport system ATP-binding protein